MLVIDYLTGTTLENASFRDPDVLRRAAEGCRRLHEGPRFTGDFDMFRRRATYLATVREHGYRLFDGYLDHDDDFERVRRALAVGAQPTVPCNNDLLAGNFVDDGDRMWLIDYEYSGNNDACFELGNTATECDLDDDQVEALVAAYFGEVRPRPAGPGAPAVAGLGVRLVALGVDPGLRQHPRLRLRGLGAGAPGQGGRDVPRAALRTTAGRGDRWLSCRPGRAW